jgi:glutathione synthase/RimK-type ligase-like ATP-grasp enzyme
VIALATCEQLPDLDPDDRLLRAALGDAAAPVWDDPAVDWDAFDVVLPRNTWDYIVRRDEFLAWADRVGTRLLNPPEVVRWNTDKRYLGELTEAGLPVVPTAVVLPGDPLPAPPLVVKPAVGAGSIDAARHSDHESAAAHVARLEAAGHVVLAQPYIAAVEEVGETALIYLGGTFSHAIRKGALLGDGTAPRDAGGLFVTEQISPREPSAAEREAGERIMAWVTERFGPLLYARVDLLPGDEPALLELELTEPSLFLGHAPGAAERLAQLIRSWTD